MASSCLYSGHWYKGAPCKFGKEIQTQKSRIYNFFIESFLLSKDHKMLNMQSKVKTK